MSTVETKILYKGVQIYQTPDEQQALRSTLQEVKDIPGEIAEVGVFQGGTAAIIREEIKDKELYLFDTFEGFAEELHPTDSPSYYVGDCKANELHVKELMKDEDKVWIIKGTFPETSDIVKDKKFAFVHIDVDIYNATKNCLEFFYPRMNKGGIILIHDYPVHAGVKKAVDDFGKEGTPKSWRQLIIKI